MFEKSLICILYMGELHGTWILISIKLFFKKI